VETLKSIMRGAVALFGLTGILTSGGCITLLPKAGKPPSIVTMRADPAIIRSRTPAPFSMGIGMPTMPALLATNKVAVRMDGGTYAFVDRLILSASAPDTLQNVILETYDRAGAAKAAVRALTVARPDYEVHFDIIAFEVTQPEGRTPGVARVEAGVRLVEVYTGKPLASTVIKAEAPAPRGDRTNPAVALEAATRKMAFEAMTWSIASATPFYASRAASATR
jgi:ABC-type uncharacterized transport system auxiliary subunit